MRQGQEKRRVSPSMAVSATLVCAQVIEHFEIHACNIPFAVDAGYGVVSRGMAHSTAVTNALLASRLLGWYNDTRAELSCRC